jgi:hypothetical protein
MTAFRHAAAFRPAAFALAVAMTVTLLAGVNALGASEYHQALVAAASASAPIVA